ncbi:MAG: pteridine reductase [Gammaproteobacteria bacterium]
MDHLSGRVALVTGGARRIGAAVVRELHTRGMRVAIHHRGSAAAAARLAAELEGARPDSAAIMAADFDDAQASAALVAAVRERFGRLDLLVNNASIFVRAPLAELTPEHWQKLLAANLTAPLFLAKAAAPLLAEQGGSIVNVTDAYANRLPVGYGAYAATKAALGDLTRSLARELAPGVRVNAVAPGAILWPETEPDAAAQKAMLAGIPLARLGEPEDIARAVAWLAGETYLTGVILPVDGGRSLA